MGCSDGMSHRSSDEIRRAWHAPRTMFPWRLRGDPMFTARKVVHARQGAGTPSRFPSFSRLERLLADRALPSRSVEYETLNRVALALTTAYGHPTYGHHDARTFVE